jgi:hypothetical protein
MQLFNWRAKTWRQRALPALTVFLVLLLASHPELRLLLPIIDALGLDLLLLLVSAQLTHYLRPALAIAYAQAILPGANWIRCNLFFLGGYTGLYADLRLSAWTKGNHVQLYP